MAQHVHVVADAVADGFCQVYDMDFILQVNVIAGCWVCLVFYPGGSCCLRSHYAGGVRQLRCIESHAGKGANSDVPKFWNAVEQIWNCLIKGYFLCWMVVVSKWKAVVTNINHQQILVM